MRENIVAGLDIGSNSVKLIVGQIVDTGRGEQLQVIGAVETPSQGISKGVVSSIDDITSAIAACLEKAERLVGVPITNAWVSINGPYIRCEKSRGVVAVSRANGEVGEDDVERAIEAARALSVPPNYEILHVVPIKYIVDNQDDIKDPIGMTAVRLEVETLIIQGLSNQIKNLIKAVHRTGLNIEDLLLSPMAAAEVVVTPKQKDLGVAVVNIGASTTSIIVFEEDRPLHTAVLPIGSEHITSDIAIGLRCPIGLAEKIKIEYGGANPDEYNKKDEINIQELLDEEGVKDSPQEISAKYLSEIIEARVEEIFEKIDSELKKIGRSGMLPAGVFLIGGGAKLANIVEVGKKQLRLPVSLGSNIKVATVIDKINDPSYLSALGLIVWGSNSLLQKGRSNGKWHGTEALKGAFEKIKKAVSSLIP